MVWPIGRTRSGNLTAAKPEVIRRFLEGMERAVAGQRMSDQDMLEAAIEAPAMTGAIGLGRAALFGRSPMSHIPGIPKTFKLPKSAGGAEIPADPIEGVVAAAHKYARDNGLPPPNPAELPKFDKARAARVADAWGGQPDAANDPTVREAYKKMAEETVAQYRALKEAGYDGRFFKKDPETGAFIDPYKDSPALGYTDLRDKKTLEVFPTKGGFGSDETFDTSMNPLMKESGEFFGDDPATYNDLFRFVHDAFGHFGHGNSFFRAPGEERAWALHRMMYSPQARNAMTAETRGQNSWVNYGPHGEHNRTAKGGDTIFGDQKLVTMPEWTLNEAAPKSIGFREFPRNVPTRSAISTALDAIEKQGDIDSLTKYIATSDDNEFITEPDVY